MRGLAHLGALSVLEREGIPIDVVAGSSAGSLIGAVYCAGLGVRQLTELANLTGWRNFASLTASTKGFVSFAKLESWLVALIGDLTFADLSKPFAVVATDLESGEPVILKEERLAPAVRASCSVPGIVPPVKMQGRLLMDGGASDNLPVAAARAMGADFVIAVDVCPPAFRRRWGPLGVGAAALETLVRRTGGGFAAADCLISPDLVGFSYVRFSQREEVMARGASATEKQLPLIQEALSSSG